MIRLRPATQFLLALLAIPPATALAQQRALDPDDPDERQIASEEGAVFGRVRFLTGTITLRRETSILEDPEMNDPVVPGDVIQSGPLSRAEVQLADGTLVRLDEDSEVVLLSLPDGSTGLGDSTVLQVLSGSILIRAESMGSAEKRFQVDTDTASIFILSDGLFRIDVREDGSTITSSRRGASEIVAEEESTMIRSGERVTVRPGRAPGEARPFNTRLRDEFDLWGSERDDALLHRERVDGRIPSGLPDPIEPYADELSYYGRWFNYPSYGWVWRPVGLAGDWQPYLSGRWAWSPGGLVWVSQEPWGWAPFHYGRWEFLVGNGWVWIPGHVFSGGWVAWSYSPGYFGWCPLGYYDYPVRFSLSIGFPRFPWIYVHSRHLYERRVVHVVVRDVTIVRDIERRRVIVRDGPRVRPDRLRDHPEVATELHTKMRGRPDLALSERSAERRTPFHEQERRRIIQTNAARIDRDPGQGEASDGSQRRPGPKVVRGAPARNSGAGATRVTPGARSRQNDPQATTPAPGNPPARRQESPPQQGRDAEARRPAPPRTRTQPGAAPNTPGPERSRPERVVPRIVPRRPPPKQEGKAETGDKPSGTRESNSQRPQRQSSESRQKNRSEREKRPD